jgi:hypothetical protein
MRRVLPAVFAVATSFANAQACFETVVMAPSPLMGNHGEIFRTAEGALFEVFGSYDYLYAYSPTVTICPGAGKMLVDGKTVNIQPRGTTGRRPAAPPAKSASQPRREQKEQPSPSAPTSAPITVVLRVRGCDYFIADGPRGLYLLQHYGGYDPDRGDGIHGEVRGYGFTTVIYANGSEGRLYVDDYLLSRDSAQEKLKDKCR